MTDPRLRQLAESLINYSLDIKQGEKVLIEVFDCDETVAEEMIKAVVKRGGIPFIDMVRSRAEAMWLKNLTPEAAELQTKWDEARMKDMDAYVAFRGPDNSYEKSMVPSEKLSLYNQVYMKRVHHEVRICDTKWVVLRYPNAAMAQMSGMSTEDFEDFYFKVCNLDYAKMDKAMDPLIELINKTDKVRITAKDTDLTFSIKGIGGVKCAGHMNIPDGEVYTAPVRESVNGTIAFNTPSTLQGFKYDSIKFTFKDGKIVSASSNDISRMESLLNTDEGARYVGEFALGVNPFVTQPMGDTLFDEKIAGSFHFTPGSCYDDAYNGNKSSVHWDLVLIQTPEYGGGEIWFDDVLIRKDGRFVLPALLGLNPENLA